MVSHEQTLVMAEILTGALVAREALFLFLEVRGLSPGFNPWSTTRNDMSLGRHSAVRKSLGPAFAEGDGLPRLSHHSGLQFLSPFDLGSTAGTSSKRIVFIGVTWAQHELSWPALSCCQDEGMEAPTT